MSISSLQTTTLAGALLVAFSFGLFVACGGSGGEGATQSTGQTECSHGLDGECGPGTYCDSADEICAVGCTSNSNCTSPEKCRRDTGEAIGFCSETDPYASSNHSNQPTIAPAGCANFCNRVFNWLDQCFGPWEPSDMQAEREECTQECSEEASDQELQEANECISCLESVGCDEEELCDPACTGLAF